MSNTIDILFPKLDNNTGGIPAWANPPVRIVSVAPIEFPDDFCTDSKSLMRQCNIVRSFVDASGASLELVHEIERTLYALELYVVQQYYIAVCLRFYEWAKEPKRTHTSETEAALESLEAALERLHARLAKFWSAEELSAERAVSITSRWVVLTIFHPVFAAFSSTSDLTKAGSTTPNTFAQYVGQTELGNEWYKATEALRPAAIVMDFTDGIVGTSVARWQTKVGQRKKSHFEMLEKQVRTSGIAAPARVLLAETREKLFDYSILEMPWGETLAKGSAAMQGEQGQPSAFSQHCRGKSWLTVRGAELHHLDQCSACRIKYADVQLPVPNAPERIGHPLLLGDNWGKRESWQCAQCAEDEAFAQLHLIAQIGQLQDVRIVTSETTLTVLQAQVAAA